ncbi:tRNA (N(6)-L-threonylcarbamoyladenosine(37)-C(2))-methylthiotransferase MtaB [Clostridiisalibacter paucivorans]|uniref:tRNA (N(6)-L-threonylcarbamoyladenosine(37)-C(2))- methylthiotransferase MtaB n=1 Tax=Clostridiisalibacter paucivorans TaxID=408753 RepID=UPI00047B9BE7|nr:tRNA (N(6)-L-threonylcarbamoyladenosine(37)-C(2))-methylthiotransferase MtaB [Clostridiisalibacter paucivorans]
MCKVAFHTLGCKVNQYETEAMGEIFEKRGYTIVNDQDYADIYIINTCTVTNMGDRKSRQFIRKAKRINKDAVIGVVGCYSQIAPDEVASIGDVDIVLGTQNRKDIVDLCEKVMENSQKIKSVGNIMDVSEFETLNIENVKGKTRAFVKIQDGCSQYCTYCIIPFTRGPIRSRNKDDIILEVNRLADAGFKEIVLTGIHIASYGKDLGNIRLIDIIEEINQIPSIERIRLSSVEPNMITEDFIKRVKELPKFCNHFHLSLQSGSDFVLKRMNRKYTSKEYLDKVNLIKRYMPNVGLTTDIIVGFPGETDEQFEETCKFVKKIGFLKVHVFKYSPREGTAASKFKEQINGRIKRDRSKKLIEISEEMTKKYLKGFLNKRMDVLFESDVKDHVETMEGYTTNYIKVMAPCKSDIEGEILTVLTEHIKEEEIIGKIIEDI